MRARGARGVWRRTSDRESRSTTSRNAGRRRPGSSRASDAADDDGAREITTLLLEQAGFEVLPESDGARAVETFRRRAAQVSGIVLDHTMPGLSGTQVFEAIREVEPAVPIILVSGYSREQIPDELIARGKTRFLRKPFDAARLLHTVRQLRRSR